MSGDLSKLEKAIRNRARQPNLHVDLTRIRYGVHSFYTQIPEQLRHKALYVGVGHGHDAVLALLDNLVEEVDGVDPFEHDTGGQGEHDRLTLLRLIDDCNLGGRFRLHKARIEDYLSEQREPVDLIVCPDVLHHIVTTREVLHLSPYYESTVQLFLKFADAGAEHAMLALSEVQRNGLRPWLKNRGLIEGNVKYRTKQSWSEWKRAAEVAGWHLEKARNYVPFRFRHQAFLLQGTIGRYTLCDRYALYFSRGSVPTRIGAQAAVNSPTASLVPKTIR